MTGLLPHLKTLRRELVASMAAGLKSDERDWHDWLALLAQVQAAVEACEAVGREAQDGS